MGTEKKVKFHRHFFDILILAIKDHQSLTATKNQGKFLAFDALDLIFSSHQLGDQQYVNNHPPGFPGNSTNHGPTGDLDCFSQMSSLKLIGGAFPSYFKPRGRVFQTYGVTPSV